MLGNPNRTRQKEAVVALQAAMKSGDENAVKQAWEQFHESVVESVKADYEMAAGDRAALAQRGYRQLTGAETEFYCRKGSRSATGVYFTSQYRGGNAGNYHCRCVP